MNVSPKSEELFRNLVKDAGNWSGTPLYEGDRRTNGNLTDLKKKLLIETWEDEDLVWVFFTENGKRFARELGFGDEYIRALKICYGTSDSEETPDA